MAFEKRYKKDSDTLLFDLMDKISAEAEKNGVTAEKLGELLEWDEQTLENIFGKDYKKY